MRAEIAATGVAHYANKSTSVHLLVEAGSNRASAVDEQRVKPNLHRSLGRIGADRLAIYILVSSAAVLRTPTVDIHGLSATLAYRER